MKILNLQEREITNALNLREGGYVVKTLTTEEELVKSYRLRHLIFSETLRWVSKSPGNLEVDEYDGFAVPFGVFRGDEMLAYIRLVLSKDYYMLEKDFRVLVRNGHHIRKDPDTGETSRFCVHPEARADKVAGYNVYMFLFKGLYTWCCTHDVRFLYTVVEEKIYRLLCARGFPCKPVGDSITMEDGTVALAVTVDWREFEMLNTAKRPGLLAWFQSSSSEMAVATA
jgi:N-acyl-L-homoserine lactone synthetase